MKRINPRMNPQKKHRISTAAQKQREKRMIKRIAFVVVCALLALAVVAGGLALALHLARGRGSNTEELPSDAFYAADYTENILENKDYARFDRSVMYLEYGSGESLSEANCKTLGVASEFFYRYFEAIIGGDAQAYRALLTEEYIRKNQPPERFTMQMLYDIRVNMEQYPSSATYQDQTVTAYYFSVQYKIYRNNGTFRRDIGSNQSKTLYFELLDTPGGILLNAMSEKKMVLAG